MNTTQQIFRIFCNILGDRCKRLAEAETISMAAYYIRSGVSSSYSIDDTPKHRTRSLLRLDVICSWSARPWSHLRAIALFFRFRLLPNLARADTVCAGLVLLS